MQTYQKKAKPSACTVPRSRPAAAHAPQQSPLRGMSDLSPVEHPGRPVDLPAAIQSKMESAFGADLSGVKLYESQAVADAGADALAQGSHIAFAPGQLDLVSMRGQALLGHELSHVVSQARGEVRGSGLLENHALEARADREGMMAAMGQSIYPGATASPGESAAVAAAGATGANGRILSFTALKTAPPRPTAGWAQTTSRGTLWVATRWMPVSRRLTNSTNSARPWKPLPPSGITAAMCLAGSVQKRVLSMTAILWGMPQRSAV